MFLETLANALSKLCNMYIVDKLKYGLEHTFCVFIFEPWLVSRTKEKRKCASYFDWRGPRPPRACFPFLVQAQRTIEGNETTKIKKDPMGNIVRERFPPFFTRRLFRVRRPLELEMKLTKWQKKIETRAMKYEREFNPRPSLISRTEFVSRCWIDTVIKDQWNNKVNGYFFDIFVIRILESPRKIAIHYSDSLFKKTW